MVPNMLKTEMLMQSATKTDPQVINGGFIDKEKIVIKCGSNKSEQCQYRGLREKVQPKYRTVVIRIFKKVLQM